MPTPLAAHGPGATARRRLRTRRIAWPLLLLAVLAACIPPSRSGTKAGATGTPAPGATEPVPTGMTIARIRARGLLRVGVRFDLDPFGFVTPDGDLAGFDVDLAREFARRWLGDPARVDFYQITPGTAAAKLGPSGVDLLLGMLPRDRALETVADFAQPYAVAGSGYLVREGTVLQRFGDLAGRAVAAPEGEPLGREIAERAAGQGISVTVQTYVTPSLALAALESGTLFAMAGDFVLLAADARAQPGLVLAPVRFTPAYAAPAVAQGDTVFRSVVDFTLEAMKADGTYDGLYARWFPGDAAPPLDAWPGTLPFGFADAPVREPPAQSAVDRLRAGEPLRVGILADRPGWSLIDGTGAASGFAVDLINECLHRWISATATADFVAVTPADGQAALANGRIDLLAAPLNAQADLLDRADVSIPYFQDGYALLVSPRRKVQSLEDLNGLAVAAPDQVSAQVLQNALAGHAVTVTLTVYSGLDAAMAAWDADEANVVVGRLTALAPINHARQDVSLVGPLLAPETPLVLGLPVDDGRLRDLVNFTLMAMVEDKAYGEIYSSWYGSVPRFPVPLWPGAPGDLGVNIARR